MAKKWLAKIKDAWIEFRDFLDEKAIRTANLPQLSRLHRFAHFWLMVAKSFSRNRCPIRASALAYTTLLALIPMLAVAISVSTSMLKDQGTERVTAFIDKLVDSMTPPTEKKTKPAPANVEDTNVGTNTTGETNAPPADSQTAGGNYLAVRQQAAETINGFIKNTNSGKLGALGTVVLVFVAISMLARIEATFNDIWGVTQGRSWIARIVQYWAVITLAPILLVGAVGMAGKPHLQATKRLLESMPFLGSLFFQILPIVVLCLSFAVFYMLMPNTKVHWDAALVGGFVGGALWHLNNVVSVLYVSRWVTNSKIYGSLAAIPVFMVGLYFSWLILLFGAQVAYAFQNRAAYLQERQCENVSQRGREFIALRVMQCLGDRFQRGEKPATVPELADGLVVPTRLLQQIMTTMMAARLVVEVTGKEMAYAPARPLETITCHDILLALRAGQGQELATGDCAARTEVQGEFERILEAERQAASNVTVLAMVNRAEERAALSARKLAAVTDGKPG